MFDIYTTVIFGGHFFHFEGEIVESELPTIVLGIFELIGTTDEEIPTEMHEEFSKMLYERLIGTNITVN